MRHALATADIFFNAYSNTITLLLMILPKQRKKYQAAPSDDVVNCEAIKVVSKRESERFTLTNDQIVKMNSNALSVSKGPCICVENQKRK